MEDNNKIIEEQKIIINLTESLNSRPFEGTNIIHKAEFKKVIDLINDKIDKVKKTKDNNCDERNRFNDTITILGSRGSGKTSFLMSILKEYEKNEDVQVIELIDPTLIEEKGHIFLTLISLIQDKVENTISKKECDPCCKDYQQRKCWENKLMKLAAGLPSIDINSGSPYSNWDDPEHVMKKGLNTVKAAKKLEENFDEIVKSALEIIGKKAFLIAFDDIDINFNNGWKVLETLRKYLTSPRIITLLSGDIKLFSKAIRKQQWINLGDHLLTYEGEKLKRIGKFDEMVTEVEGQYMQKIMKAPYRIHLLTIGEMLNGNHIIIKNSKSENISIYEYYKNQLNKFGIHNKYEIHSVNTYLLGLPLRTQIQLLSQFENIMNNGYKSLEILNITDSFISDMYESGVDVELAKSQPKDFCYIAHEFLLNKELLNETYQLLPTSGSVNYNAVLFSLFTMFVAHSRNNPSMFFEYWITIATIKNLLTLMPYRSEHDKDTKPTPTIEGLAEYSFIGQNKVYRDICSYLSTYIRATLNNKSANMASWGGTLLLKGNDSNETQKRIDQIFAEESMISVQLASFPMSIASFAHKQQSIVIYSLYTLLGTIVELLKRFNIITKDKNNETLSEETVNDIYVLLKELSQIKDNVMPTFEKAVEYTDDEQIYNNLEEDKDDNDKSLARALCIWMKSCPDNVPPHVIGKTATRSFYAMRKLDDKTLTDNNLNLGDSMHRRIVIVMNSALVEDAKENLKSFNLSNNNPSEKNNIFINNMDKIINEKECERLKFSSWLISCPLFLLYLNPESNISDSEPQDLWKRLGVFINYIYNDDNNNCCYDNSGKYIGIEWFKSNSIYNNLKNVGIHGKVVRKKTKKMSISKNNISKTINEIKKFYNTPSEFAKSDTDKISNNLNFDKKGITKQINSLKKHCEGCSTWEDVTNKIKAKK